MKNPHALSRTQQRITVKQHFNAQKSPPHPKKKKGGGERGNNRISAHNKDFFLFLDNRFDKGTTLTREQLALITLSILNIMNIKIQLIIGEIRRNWKFSSELGEIIFPSSFSFHSFKKNWVKFNIGLTSSVRMGHICWATQTILKIGLPEK